MIDVIDETFNYEVLGAGTPVVVCFSAQWCAPCRAMEPLLNDLIDSYKIMKMNVDENPITSTNYMIRSVPTLMVFKQGVPVATHSSALMGTKLKEWLDNAVRNS